VQRFRNGRLNVLVATCIGEEGLDVGEVDLIVCIDAQKASVVGVRHIDVTMPWRAGSAFADTTSWSHRSPTGWVRRAVVQRGGESGEPVHGPSVR
jgi:superfamily II DNA/RNA helicase